MDQVDGIAMIEFERARQVLEKKYDAAHDDAHTDGSIVQAAIDILDDFYAGADFAEPVGAACWPGDLARKVETKYADDPIRRLTIAGALIAAEIDRLLRVQARQQKSPAEGSAE